MSDILADLPDDVRDIIAPHIAPDPAMLDAISVAIAQKRDEAKTARTSSGIEQLWTAAEEAYLGIDDANRHEFAAAKWSKPMSSDGPVTTDRKPAQPDYKSTVFTRLTARYVDAAAAKLGEILLPPGDKAFSFSETPVPELLNAKDDTSQVVHDGLGGVPLTRPAQPGEAPAAAPMAASMAVWPPSAGPQPQAQPGQPAPAPQVPLTVADLAKEAIELARKKAKKAETRVYDWLLKSRYQAEYRKAIFDAARLGVCVLKGPFPKPYRDMAVKGGKKGAPIEVIIKEGIFPAIKQVDPWNCFPDPACGEDIHEGEYFNERDYLSDRQVRDLKKVSGYIAAQIDKVLEEGPEKIYTRENDRQERKDEHKNRYEVWYHYGTLKREEYNCICASGGKTPDPGKPEAPVFIIATLINDTIIRATINPLDSGRFPYHSFPWQRRAGNWVGVGVPEQLFTPQKMLNAAVRAMLNNAGQAAGPQVVIDQGVIVPADGVRVLTPGKIWNKLPDSIGDDVRKAFEIYEIPSATNDLMKIIEFSLQMAEESTSIPLITQGQSGRTTPDTFGAAQLQDNNANQLLRSIGYSWDDCITVPVTQDYYEWFLLDPEVPEDEKGDFEIDAHGSGALVERAIQDQTIAQMGPLVLNPAYGMDPKKWADQFIKSKRLDPDDLKYTEEEQARLDAQPPPAAPAVEAAKISADTQLKLGVMKQGTEQQSVQSEERIAQATTALEGQKVHVGATVDLHALENERQLLMLKYALQHGLTLLQAKTDLAQTTMKLNVQERLNAQDNAHDLRKHVTPSATPPPVQVPGRSRKGKAFSQAK